MPSAIDNGNLPAEGEREREVLLTRWGGREGGREDRREEAGQRQRAFKLDAHRSRTLETNLIKVLTLNTVLDTMFNTAFGPMQFY